VYGWKTDEFPAFFSPESGVSCPFRADSASEVADAFKFSRALGLPNGFLVGVPNDDTTGANVEEAVQLALEEAEKHGVRGQDATPFILKYVADKTGGKLILYFNLCQIFFSR
jgi:pseudouridine-5'-phosphate glycosidase